MSNTKKNNRPVRSTLHSRNLKSRKQVQVSNAPRTVDSGRSKTRRVSNTQKGLTIPELKHSFDSLESEIKGVLSLPEPKQVKAFQEVWRRIFGRPVDAAAATAYLQVKAREVLVKSPTRKAKGMRGGSAAALAGATLDYQTRPGVDGVYGSFPSYISNGFSFYNTINQSAISKDCGVQDITPKIAADLGSNQAGGGSLTDALTTALNRPFTSGTPVPSIGKDLQDMWMGRSIGPSPSPVENPYLK